MARGEEKALKSVLKNYDKFTLKKSLVATSLQLGRFQRVQKI